MDVEWLDVPLGMDLNELRRYAAEGARVQIANLKEQIANILAIFPEFRRNRETTSVARSGTLRKSHSAAAATPPTRKPRGRRTPMTAAERRVVSERMEKYWAARPAEAEQGSTAAPARQASGPKRGPRKMSEADRKRISEAQKAVGEVEEAD